MIPLCFSSPSFQVNIFFTQRGFSKGCLDRLLHPSICLPPTPQNSEPQKQFGGQEGKGKEVAQERQEERRVSRSSAVPSFGLSFS